MQYAAKKMEIFQFEKTSFQIEPFDSEKLSIRVTNVDKSINTDLFLWLERDSIYTVYFPETQNTHQAAMALAEILRANATNLFSYRVNESSSYLTLLNRVAQEIARGAIMVNWALEAYEDSAVSKAGRRDLRRVSFRDFPELWTDKTMTSDSPPGQSQI